MAPKSKLTSKSVAAKTNGTTSSAIHPPPQTDQPTMDEELQLETYLRNLKEMHLRLIEARSIIPNLLSPLTRPHSSPDGLISSLAVSADAATAQLEQLRSLMTSKQAKLMFAQAAQSRQAQPMGIKPWLARNDPNWAKPDT